MIPVSLALRDDCIASYHEPSSHKVSQATLEKRPQEHPHLDLTAWCCTCRFQSTFLASQAVTGSLATSGLLEAKDAQGMTLMEALRQGGFAQNPADLSTSSIKPEHVEGYATVPYVSARSAQFVHSTRAVQGPGTL